MQLVVNIKQVGLVAWSKCMLSHLGIAGLSLSHDNSWKPLGEYAAPCKIVYNQWNKSRQKYVSFSGHISDRLSVVSVRAEQHKGSAPERVRSSAAYCRGLVPGAWKIWPPEGSASLKGTTDIIFFKFSTLIHSPNRIILNQRHFQRVPRKCSSSSQMTKDPQHAQGYYPVHMRSTMQYVRTRRHLKPLVIPYRQRRL